MRAADWWETADDPIRMLDRAGRRLTDRAALLFACGCARRVWEKLQNPHREAGEPGQGAADTTDPEERRELLRGAVAAVAGNLVAFAYRVFQPEPDPAVIAREAATLLQALDPPAAD